MSLICNHYQSQAQAASIMAKKPVASSSFDNNSKQKDKIQFNSSRGSNHEVAADNWRIRYYMNLNLVKQPHPMMNNNLNQRSLSLPRQFHTPPSKMPSHNNNHNHNNNNFGDNLKYKHKHHHQQQHGTKNRDSRQNSLEHIPMDANDHELHEDPLALMHQIRESQNNKNTQKRRKNTHKSNNITTHKSIKKTKSQNNTPPRSTTLNSLFRSRSQNHNRNKKGGIGLRQRSRSDGLLSFQITRSVDSIKEMNNNNNAFEVCDNDSVGTADSVPLSSTNSVSYSSRTPPRHTNLSNHSMSLNNRSKPMSISSQKLKTREDVDFKHSIDNINKNQREIRTNPSDFLESLHNDAMLDDDANFEMD